ncbi:MAG: DUF1068 domain-containing protein [Gloeomargarita sp. SKYG116]|nr:DUF1068 domain-containing protein [Gloeomargarita sp. SKYG116]MCS7226176.1 DUF1068 domain-containing protein [Gloeomargarita sp. SKYB31]MDW8400635.1 DUF1068 domain-containing protein [Gloeomargarita sp. SKYGB_i_bin116]
MVKRQTLEDRILAQWPELVHLNLQFLKKEHLEAWLVSGKVTLTVEELVAIFRERNQRAQTNLKLNRENFGLRAKLRSTFAELTNWSKSEIINLYKRLFGKVSKQEDDLLREIGAVSQESAREDLKKAEVVVEEAKKIAQQYQKKYGQLN